MALFISKPDVLFSRGVGEEGDPKRAHKAKPDGVISHNSIAPGNAKKQQGLPEGRVPQAEPGPVPPPKAPGLKGSGWGEEIIIFYSCQQARTQLSVRARQYLVHLQAIAGKEFDQENPFSFFTTDTQGRQELNSARSQKTMLWGVGRVTSGPGDQRLSRVLMCPGNGYMSSCTEVGTSSRLVIPREESREDAQRASPSQPQP